MEDGAEDEAEEEPEVEEPPTKVWLGFEASESLGGLISLWDYRAHIGTDASWMPAGTLATSLGKPKHRPKMRRW